MASEKHLAVLDLLPELRALVGESEVTGGRTIFTRDERPVAILIAYDEYLALRETIDVAKDDTLRAMLAAAEDEIRRNAMILPEDLFELDPGLRGSDVD